MSQSSTACQAGNDVRVSSPVTTVYCILYFPRTDFLGTIDLQDHNKSSTVDTLLSGRDPYPVPEVDNSLPGVPSRAEFTALVRRFNSLEASLQRQNVLHGNSGARKRRSRGRNSGEVKEDDEDPKLRDYEDEESYDEGQSDGADEWLP